MIQSHPFIYTACFFLSCLVIAGFSFAQGVGPQYCGDQGTVYPQGDLNGDCYVNFKDFSIFAANWLVCSDPLDSTCTLRFLSQEVQNIYLSGVPHTNAHGIFRLSYDASESFFPIMMWDVPASAGDWTWSNLTAAGFNTAVPGRVQWPAQLAAWGDAANLQVVLMTPFDNSRLSSVTGHPHILGNVWMEEPTSLYGQTDMAQLYSDFQTYRNNARTIVPNMLVFVSDNVLKNEVDRSWWTTWNIGGDISCHKNFAIEPICDSLGLNPVGIPQSVSLAVQANDELKPMWLILGAHESIGTGSARFPTPQQLRCEVYAGIIHGATGIAYYAWDSARCRANGVIGMAANPQASYQSGQLSATPLQLAQSRALWDETSHINQELALLKISLLSPTINDAMVYYELQITGETVSNTPIRTLLKPWPAGGYVLLTVNVDNAVGKLDDNDPPWICPEPLRVTYTWEKSLQTVEPLFENKPALNIGSGSKSFTVVYDPFEVHVYRVELAE